jgi:hypothetical protein
MNKEDPFLAEAMGMANGSIMGRRQGREQGYAQGWDEAVALANQKITALTQEKNDLAWGFNSLLAVTAAALDTLEKGPAGQRHAVVMDYLSKVDSWRQSGHLRGIPHADPVMRLKSPETAMQMQSWVEAAIAQAKLQKRDSAPTP